MPVVVRKVRNKKCYNVKENKAGVKLYSKCTSLAKAKAKANKLNSMKVSNRPKPRLCPKGAKVCKCKLK